mmetsp:Transcript_64218/g.73725  ORF Transcript_64218/g.73725 Transcript_64218/m.73725 type:complete len:109 (-) Transcript_64218:553-879(-)
MSVIVTGFRVVVVEWATLTGDLVLGRLLESDGLEVVKEVMAPECGLGDFLRGEVRRLRADTVVVRVTDNSPRSAKALRGESSLRLLALDRSRKFLEKVGEISTRFCVV